MTKKENDNLELILEEELPTLEQRYMIGRFTNSHYFLLPIFKVFGIGRFMNNYIGTFIADQKRDAYLECPIYIAFKFDELDSPEFEECNKYFSSLGNLQFSYVGGTTDKKNIIVYVLKCESNLIKDYKSIIRGRYSEISSSAKALFDKFPFIQSVKVIIEGILNKSKWLRNKLESDLDVKINEDAELWDPFSLERETFRYEKKK